MKTIVHLSTVHSPHDTRIFHKECRSLAKAGFRVFLVIPADEDSVRDGVVIRALPEAKGGRIGRMVGTVGRALMEAVRLEGDAYHFHDPELIPAALLLRLRGKPVVYDIHEDYVTDIEAKTYLPGWFRKVLAPAFGRFEGAAALAFHPVLAERYYEDRFPDGLQVCNYPVIEGLDAAPEDTAPAEGIHLLYTGNVDQDRGALLMANLMTMSDDIHLTCVGRCWSGIADQMRTIAGDHVGRMELVGVDGHVPFPTIVEYTVRGGWTAGMALFPYHDHYLRKELTKFFEYMAAGLPVVCSDFPTWRRLVEEHGVGICVNPDDPEKALEAVQFLRDHPDERAAMVARGRELARSRFNWDNDADKLVRLYRHDLFDERDDRE
jgi:glycosyltransferase involved in cell wall biosynthesis